MKVCRWCGSPKIPPARVRQRHYVCTKCLNATPTARACRKRWKQKHRTTAAGQAYDKALDARRLRFGTVDFGWARTEDEKRAIKAQVHATVTAYKASRHGADARHASGTETQDPAPGAVQGETAI